MTNYAILMDKDLVVTVVRAIKTTYALVRDKVLVVRVVRGSGCTTILTTTPGGCELLVVGP